MTDDTTMMSDALVTSEKRPRRPLLSFLTRWYSVIFAVAVSLILLVSAGLYAPYWTGLWIALYWVYQGAKYLMRRHKRHGFPYDSKWVQFGRALLMILCVAVFLAYLYRDTDYLAANGATDMLWLLFVLAAFHHQPARGDRVVGDGFDFCLNLPGDNALLCGRTVCGAGLQPGAGVDREREDPLDGAAGVCAARSDTLRG